MAKLKSKFFGKCGAVECTLSGPKGQIGILRVTSGSLTWYEGRKTDNNKHHKTWKEFRDFVMGEGDSK